VACQLARCRPSVAAGARLTSRAAMPSRAQRNRPPHRAQMRQVVPEDAPNAKHGSQGASEPEALLLLRRATNGSVERWSRASIRRISQRGPIGPSSPPVAAVAHPRRRVSVVIMERPARRTRAIHERSRSPAGAAEAPDASRWTDERTAAAAIQRHVRRPVSSRPSALECFEFPARYGQRCSLCPKREHWHSCGPGSMMRP
jgi:hypothetical protein